VTQLDWSADGRLLMSNALVRRAFCHPRPAPWLCVGVGCGCGWCEGIGLRRQDHEILIWEPRKGARAVDQSQRDTEWHTWTCLLGFPVTTTLPALSSVLS
jgi:hypothetical protein